MGRLTIISFIVLLGSIFICYADAQEKNVKMILSTALIKYGYSNFSLEILEYCAPEKAIEREQYYLDLLKPEYNILRIAGSILGYKHSEETIAKLKMNLKGRTWTLTPEQKAKLKTDLKGRSWTWTSEQKEKLKGFRHNQSTSQKVEVIDTIKNETTVYLSMGEAARSIECSKVAIHLAIKDQEKKGVSRRGAARERSSYLAAS